MPSDAVIMGNVDPVLFRNGTPEDIGKAVVFLAGEGASYITGEVLRVDGGLILPGMPEKEEAGKNSWGGEKVE